MVRPNIKIKATYRSCRGVAECRYCPKDPTQTYMIATYKHIEDPDEAEKTLYEYMFSEELDIQNKKYKMKGNYGRIKDMDEWRTSPRHRPIENVLQVGNKEHCFAVKDLWAVYSQFCEWRKERFGNNFMLISAAIYKGSDVPHIHERYVLYWTDDNGIRHTGIDKALAQAGIEPPIGNSPENRYNNKKLAFDLMCRRKILDLLEERLKLFKGVELERPDPKYRLRIKVDREFRLQYGHERALYAAEGRICDKMNMLADRLEVLEAEEEMLRREVDADCRPYEEMDQIKERLRIVTGKIKDYTKRLDKAEKKHDAIVDAMTH